MKDSTVAKAYRTLQILACVYFGWEEELSKVYTEEVAKLHSPDHNF